jgi:hypothetical protein
MQLVEKVERSKLIPERFLVFDKLVLQYDAHNAIRQIAKYTTVKGGMCGLQCQDKLDRLITYIRNKEGFILESREDDYKEDTTTVTRYNYVYKGY